MIQPIHLITQQDVNFPVSVNTFLNADTPDIVWTRGNIALLPEQANVAKEDLWALFCSSKCPGEIILKTHDWAQKFKDDGAFTIGGFHSPIEKECLRVLLRGTQPIIICCARNIENMRLKPEWKQPISDGRLLILSMFSEKRISATRAHKRNLFVAALASKIFIAHAAEDSKTLAFAQTILQWGKPVYTFDSSYNEPLLHLGAKPLIGG